MNRDEALKFYTERKTAYRLMFARGPGDPETVALADLRQFCFADGSTIIAPSGGAVDIERTMAAQGRREVWLRIQDYLTLTPEQLVALYTKPLKTGDTAYGGRPEPQSEPES